MDVAMIIEVFGYIGSILVVVSMLMSSVVKLRIINTVGSTVSAIYAVICGAIPLALMNASLIVINIYNLTKLLNTKTEYDLVEGTSDDGMVKYFVKHYAEDISKYFPEFTGETMAQSKAYVVCCGGTPVGMLLGKEADGGFEVQLDYSVPAYRDCSVGKYLYEQLTSKGISKLFFTQNKSSEHDVYLNKMGFKKEHDVYVKKLN